MTRWLESVVQARYLVAALGESSSPPWWRSEATTPAGRRMLERIYPRTALTASLESASRAARRIHDARLARARVFHLFRLPPADESLLHDLLQEPEKRLLLQPLADLQDQGARLAALKELAGGQRATAAEGPLLCGQVGDFRSGLAFKRVCAAYLEGFVRGLPVYPYLEAPRG